MPFLWRHARRWRRALQAGGLLTAAWAAAVQPATPLPAGLSFVARDASGAWGVYRVDEGRRVVRVPTQLEPRQACISSDGSRWVYAAADGSVRLVARGDETVLARPDARRGFTQPCLSADGRQVYLVEMADGKSVETEILRYTAGAAEPERIARQPGAQQDPYVHGKRWLVYASVGCSAGCDELLVEIWLRDLLAGKTRQLTLLNALSQGPVTDGRRVVFSSNASGTHQLWQVDVDGSGLRQLTRMPSRQSLSPALCGGAVHFVYSGPGGATIARLADDGQIVELPIPGLDSFRSLRCL